MTKRPRVTGQTIVKALAKAGFEVKRIRGSHHFLKHSDGRCTVVPIHGREIIGPGLFNKILHDCDLTLEEFTDLL